MLSWAKMLCPCSRNIYCCPQGEGKQI